MSEIAIRQVTEFEDMVELEAVQQEVWGARAILGARYLQALQMNGAALLGAYDGDHIVGFALGVLGTVRDESRIDQVAAARLKMYSMTMAIHPDYQGLGIGTRLKMAQRDFANVIGVRLITWTFDPLLGRNAWLAIGKLGAICRAYEVNMYGEVDGLPEDRLVAEWWVTGNRARARVSGRRSALSLQAFLDGGAILVNLTRPNEEGWLVPQLKMDAEGGNVVLVEIPADFRTVMQQDFELARVWRYHIRELLSFAFSRGYIITDFVRYQEEESGRPRNYYVLTHQNA